MPKQSVVFDCVTGKLGSLAQKIPPWPQKKSNFKKALKVVVVVVVVVGLCGLVSAMENGRAKAIMFRKENRRWVTNLQPQADISAT